MTNLQKVKELVIEAVPEIMELKFGCEVIAVAVDEVTSPRPDENVSLDELSWDKDEEYEYRVTGEEPIISKGIVPVIHSISPAEAHVVVEILGRPIFLADVLMAFNGLKDDNENRHWVVNRHGEFLNGALCDIPTHSLVGKTWNLSLPLSGQSPDTIDFLLDILKKDKYAIYDKDEM